MGLGHVTAIGEPREIDAPSASVPAIARQTRTSDERAWSDTRA